mgnify:CR=1 FL=1
MFVRGAGKCSGGKNKAKAYLPRLVSEVGRAPAKSVSINAFSPIVVTLLGSWVGATGQPKLSAKAPSSMVLRPAGNTMPETSSPYMARGAMRLTEAGILGTPLLPPGGGSAFAAAYRTSPALFSR